MNQTGSLVSQEAIDVRLDQGRWGNSLPLHARLPWQIGQQFHRE